MDAWFYTGQRRQRQPVDARCGRGDEWVDGPVCVPGQARGHRLRRGTPGLDRLPHHDGQGHDPTKEQLPGPRQLGRFGPAGLEGVEPVPHPHPGSRSRQQRRIRRQKGEFVS